MKTRYLKSIPILFIAALHLVLVGCGSSEAKIVAELKEIVALHQKGANGGKNYQFDVKKTDSLVSPYTGVVTYLEKYSVTNQAPNGKVYPEISFSYQDRAWVAKSSRYYVVWPNNPNNREWKNDVSYLEWDTVTADYYGHQK